MDRRQFIGAIFGTIALSQLPRAIAAPAADCIPANLALMGMNFGDKDFTVEFWMSRDPKAKTWDLVTLVQKHRETAGYVNGIMPAMGADLWKDYRFQGSAILAETVAGGESSNCLRRFFHHMQKHMSDGYLADIRVTEGAARTPDEWHHLGLSAISVNYTPPLTSSWARQ